jgi:hypothetical protein
MFERLRALAAWFRREGFNTFPPLADPNPPLGVRHPRWGGPGGKNLAATVPEPIEQDLTNVQGIAVGGATTTPRDAG